MAIKGEIKTEEHKRKIAIAHIGMKASKEAKLNMSLAHKGKHYSLGTQFKKGIYQGNGFKKNQRPWNYGSKDFEPYGQGWTNILKESIRVRDNYKCQECGMLQEDCNRALDVHHINGIKADLNPDNLISLCRNCHSSKGNNISKQKLSIIVNR